MNAELLTMLDYLEREKGISRDILVDAICNALLTASKKSFSIAREVRVEMNPKTGQIRAFAKPLVVDKVVDPQEHITLAKARQINPEAQIGDEVEIEVTPRDFGRIAAQTARQAIMQRIRQVEKDMMYEEFKDRAGEIVSGTVRRFERSDVIVDLGKFEGIMQSRERVPTEEYSIGDRIRAYVVAVENGVRGPEIILSRSHPNFVRRLFEVEVSEIADRTVELKVIAREAGARTKVAVHSSDNKVDPVGACVGMRGARVKNIVRELNNEKVDIIRWYDDPEELVKEALKPAQLRSITLNHEEKRITVIVGKEELSQAIGRKGQNARLTAKITGWDIDIQEDRTAEQAMESQKAQAASSLADQLSVSQEEADTLTAAGMISPEVIATASAEDIAGVLGTDEETGQRILDEANKQNTPADSPAAA
ncbi:MAG: transcription termination factor NusA [Chthoniobacterales bacterium]